jgi:hypothetical protein
MSQADHQRKRSEQGNDTLIYRMHKMKEEERDIKRFWQQDNHSPDMFFSEKTIPMF